MWALGEIVKAQAGVLEQDSSEEIAHKIRQMVEDTLAGTGEEARVEAHLLALLGLAEEAQLGGDRRNEAFAAWRRFLEGLAEQRPLVARRSRTSTGPTRAFSTSSTSSSTG